MRWLLCSVLVVLAACSSSKDSGTSGSKTTTIRVAAASSLARAFTEVGGVFEKARPNTKVVFDFGSSGLFAKQIEQGAPFHLFAAADKAYVDQVIEAGKCDASTAALYSRGRVVLWSRAGAPARLEDLTDPKYKRIGLANPDQAPYGKAAIQAMEKAGIYAAIKDRLVLAESVLAALTYAKEGSVDVSFVALSLIVSSDVKGYTPIELDLHEPLEQTLVVCGKGAEAEAAKAFAAFVTGKDGRAIMERFGFSTTGVLPTP